MIAQSDDPLLLNWETLTGNTVYPFREWAWKSTHADPFTCKEGDFCYCLLGGVHPKGPGGKPLIASYLSKLADLINWENFHKILEDDYYSLVEDDRSCPYFLPVGN